MRKRQILAGLVVLLIGLYMSGCMELMPKEKQTFQTRGKGVYQGFNELPGKLYGEDRRKKTAVSFTEIPNW